MKNGKNVPLGFEKDIPIGNHIALLYNNDDERYNIIAKYLQSGLKNNEKVLYVVDGDVDNFKNEMEKRGFNLPLDKIVIDTVDNVYCPKGFFSSDEMLMAVKMFIEQCNKEGFSSTRGSGEMTWALRYMEDSEELMVYESSLNDIVLNESTIAFCQYDTRKYNGETIIDVLRTHPLVISKGKLIQNPYYVKPNEFIENYHSHALI